MIKKLSVKVLIPFIVLFMLIGLNVNADDCAIYTVKSGDCLWIISQNFNVNFSDVIIFNPQFENPDLIYPGDKVYVPVNVVNIDRPDTKIPDSPETPGAESPAPATETPATKAPDIEIPNTEAPITNIPDTQISDTTKPSENNPGIGELSDLEAQVLKLVNIERANEGVPALTINMEVTNVARAKSVDMINNNYFDHKSPKYGSMTDMLNVFGIQYSAAGENIAKGQNTADAVMKAWLNSPGHRANILSSTFTQIGISCVTDANGTAYWTQLFIRP